MKTLKFMLVAAAAAVFAGCAQKTEAEKFGYRGMDAEEDDLVPLIVGTVSNMVPSRVLNVCESYEFTADERAVMAAAGLVESMAKFDKLPAGYVVKKAEPWFSTCTKDAEAFGLKGVAGFICHVDEDDGSCETGETFFSTYWPSEAEAVKTLADLRAKFAAEMKPKRFWDFDKCWVAEYVRLRVLCVCGLNPEGKWTCMLDLQDKQLDGCGSWEPVEAQRVMLARHRHDKALRAWEAAVAKTLDDNHAAILKARGVASDGGRWRSGAASCRSREDGGEFVAAGGAAEDVWKSAVSNLSAATGIEMDGAMPLPESVSCDCAFWRTAWTNAHYVAEMTLSCPTNVPSAVAETEKSEPDASEPPPPRGFWRCAVRERLQPGFELPPRPEYKVEE